MKYQAYNRIRIQYIFCFASSEFPSRESMMTAIFCKWNYFSIFK